MLLFFGGPGNEAIEQDARLGTDKRYRLLSCHANYRKVTEKIIDCIGHLAVEVEWMFDSGAFTAWNKGHTITLDELKRSYHERLTQIDKQSTTSTRWLINLDVIPGAAGRVDREAGRTADSAEIANAILTSDQNFVELVKEFGPIILPVFHQNEDEARLHEVVAMAPYICVSPRNDLPEGARVQWSKEVHDKIPGIKTHGLAVTGFDNMSQCPWWSSDSARWLLAAAFGDVFVPKRGRLCGICMSHGTLLNKHFDAFTSYEQAEIAVFFEQHGFTVQELREQRESRSVYNRVILDEYARTTAVTRRLTMPEPPPALFPL